MQLREYQSTAVADVRAAMASHRRVMLVSPTASGKTQIFSYISAGVFAKNRRVLVLAHRKELIRQIGAALNSWNVPHGVIAAGSKSIPHANVIIGNVFTVVKRVAKLQPPDLIVVDECHHATTGGTWGKILAAFPTARVFGVTATPCRLDGRGLAESFDTMVMGPSVAELTELGFLSPTEVYAPSKPNLAGVHKRMGDYVTAELDAQMNVPTITGNAVQTYLRICPNATAIVFCVSVAHAKSVADEFRSFGIAAESVDGNMHDTERDRVLEGLKAGRIKVVTSADLISEGFDCPATDCVILLRPTKSLALYLQQVGRGIRIAPGKTKTVVLDHSSNTLAHGFIDEPREWSLDGGAAKRKSGAAPIRTCPQCFAAHRPAPTCPMCGFAYVPTDRADKINFVNGELVKVVDPKSISKVDLLGSDDEPHERHRKELEYLTRTARMRGYKNPEGWAYVVCRAKEAKRRTKVLQKAAASG